MANLTRNNLNKNSFTRWLEKLSVRSKFSIIFILIVFILFFSIGTFYFGMKVMSSTRAYVGGEGLWSKAQKEAIISLLKYSSSLNEADYSDFLSFLSVPLGDKEARLELEKSSPDLQIVRSGFIQGGNSPDDVNDLIFLYRRFRHVSYMDRAIQAWVAGDSGTDQLVNVANEIHSIISTTPNKNGAKNSEATSLKLVPLIEQIYMIDKELTVLEDKFSATLSEGSRQIRDIIFVAIIILNIILGVIVLLIAKFIAKIIVQVDKTKSEFVLLASHQLRTPPTSIKWFSDMLISGEVGKLNEKQEEYIKEIYSNNQRMITLVNMLLNSSQIELGTFIVAPKLTNIVDLVNSITKEYKLQIQSKKIIIKESFEPDIPSIIIDPKLLHIVLGNIILNAIKYTPVDGKISIAIVLKKKGENIGNKRVEKNSLVIIVNDTGCGIPENESSKIFTKLFRASNVRKKDTDGTGLGLYLSKSIMENAEGDLWFESELNVGTTFYVITPLEGMNKRKGTKELILKSAD